MADTLTKLAYQTFQDGKNYFGLGHKALATQLRLWFKPELKVKIEGITPELLAEMTRRRDELLQRDWQDAEDGIYPESLLFDNPWEDFLRYYPALWLDMPKIWERVEHKQYQSFDDDIDTRHFPQYYLQNFHYQTDGYLSDDSANLYDLQVELLFNGTADAMRRRVLAPLKSGLQAVKTAKAGSQSDVMEVTNAHQIKVLDVACGTGRTLKLLRDTFPAASLYGVDLSPAYLRKANQLLSQGRQTLPQLMQGQGESLPYRDNYFDGLTCVFLFHELPGPIRQQVIEECFRVTKPGGLLVICDSIQQIDTPELEAVMASFPAIFHEPYYRDYTQDDLTQRLASVGFEDITTAVHFVSKYWVAHKPT
ncbi:class I SAM-dependent methyltransferase [Leptolyngbya sp. PCC 6406]|uniref:class I SAM-dependent methyltransferase n=1 Tax=Leptolyngbya sp. PCC 6406 TaxID=1173264 RepID=UPI0002ACF8AA|nr:class I SAM-dependent methyltransferase [Leptolyngbya sp. PCC 6406]